MAEEKLQYTLILSTQATGDGARKTTREMGELAAANRRVEDSSKRFLTAAEREVAEVERLVAGAQRLRGAQDNVRVSKDGLIRGLEATREKAKVAEFAFYDLDAAMGKTAATSQTFTAGATQVGKSSRNASQSLLLFSQGFEDAQYGMRGVLNNIPGLIISLGGTAGLAGAISIAAVGLSVLYEQFSKTEEKASDVEERIKNVSAALGQVESDRFEKVGDDLDAARAAADSLKQSFEKTQAAENAFSTAALDNAGKLEQAQKNIAIALGLQVDAFAQLKAAEQAETDKRTLKAEQELAAEQAALDKASEAKTRAADILQEASQRKDIEAVNLVQLEAQLQALRDQRDVLIKIRDAGSGSIGVRDEDVPQSLRGAVDKARAGARGPLDFAGRVQREAGKELDSEAFKIRLEGTESQVEALREDIRSLAGKENEAVNSLNKASADLFDLQGAVRTNIARISETLAADTLLADSQSALAKGETLVGELKGFADSVQSNSDRVNAAKAVIEQVAADGRLTADELAPAAEAQRQIMTALQAGIATTNQNMQSIYIIVSTIQREQADFAKQLRELNK